MKREPEMPVELAVLGRFIVMADKSWWPLPQDSEDSPPLMAAAVSLSGRLDEAETDEQLKEAVEHALKLVELGVLKTEEWSRESVRIDAMMAEWGREVEAYMRRVAESN